MSSIQSIIFKKDKYTTDEARKWLKKHKHIPIKRVDKTKEYLRYRIAEPDPKKEKRTISMGPNIKAVVQYKPKKK